MSQAKVRGPRARNVCIAVGALSFLASLFFCTATFVPGHETAAAIATWLSLALSILFGYAALRMM